MKKITSLDLRENYDTLQDIGAIEERSMAFLMRMSINLMVLQFYPNIDLPDTAEVELAKKFLETHENIYEK